MPHTELMQSRLKYLRIDDTTMAELRASRSIIEPAMEKVLNDFYADLLEQPELVELFAGESEIEAARIAQKEHWLEALFVGNYDNSYYARTEEIGRAHARLGLTPNWYIGAYNQMMMQFSEVIYDHYHDQPEQSKALIQAVSKLIFLDTDLVIQCYLDAKDEALRKMLVTSTELRADMWHFNDDFNAISDTINTASQNLQQDLSKSQDAKHLMQQCSVLTEQASALADKAQELDAYLKQLPLSEKLYLPKEGPIASFVNKLFGKRLVYQQH